MPVKPGSLITERLVRAALLFRVHLDAFRCSPFAYSRAVYWRVIGKKLRARHHFAALKGQSPNAYRLWIATSEAMQSSKASVVADPGVNTIVVVDCREDADDLSATLTSIRAQRDSAPEVVLLGVEFEGYGGYSFVQDAHELVKWLEDVAARSGKRQIWLIAIEAGDTLAPFAVATYEAERAEHPDACLFYADDDLLTEGGGRIRPHFKPRWNPELYRFHDYLSGACIFACEPASLKGQWPPAELPLDPEPIHVPMVLHHRRSRPHPVRPATKPLLSAAESPHVCVVVPTRNGVELMKTVMAGLARTSYPSFDVTVIDNDSDDPAAVAYLRELADEGVGIVRSPGPLLCFLNNDIEIVNPDWLGVLVAQAVRCEVGAVGAKLLYPDGTIQHAGILTGVGGGAGHAHRCQGAEDEGYFDRANLPQFVSAVTGACLVVRKDRFEAVGGFDAEHFAVAFNDVDLCLKLNQRGWQSFYEPRAVLIHHESKSRGFDRSGPQRMRFAGELAALKSIWSTDRVVDPYHHPELSSFGEAFVIRL